MSLFSTLPPSVLQWFAIFLSIIIEALPFVLLGTILSGCIEVFVTPDLVQKYLPKQKFLRILFGTFVGFVFPSCECGIIPIINRFLEKRCLVIRPSLFWQQRLLLILLFCLQPIPLLGILCASSCFVSLVPS